MLFRKKFLLMFLVFSFYAISPVSVFAELTAKEESALRAELSKIEAEAKQLEATLQNQKNQSATISRDVNILSNQVKQAELEIQKKNLEIKNLKSVIELKEKTIGDLNNEIEKGKKTLAIMIKEMNQMDVTSLPEIVLGNDNLSSFFADLDSYSMMQNQLEKQFDEIRAIQEKTENEKKTLEVKKVATVDAQDVIVQEKKTVAVKKQEKDYLLSASKKSEVTYSTILQEKLAKAASIRAALFKLRDSAGISFGEALKFANSAAAQTGVRPAFILGILKQESNLGVNVGQCYLTNTTTGSGIGKNTGTPFVNVMKPGRDIPIFLTMMQGLGLDYATTPVSCPQSIGYGGAMGPSQFIPSTWNMYAAKVAAAVGVSVANPWIPQHSFMATALFVRDLGAAVGGYSAEREAAARYYAGGGWATLGLGYANSVLAHAADFEQQIKFLDEVANQ